MAKRIELTEWEAYYVKGEKSSMGTRLFFICPTGPNRPATH